MIREAQLRGEFDALPGAGEPLPRASWSGGEWAMAYHVLKQAGETLPWIALAREIELAQQRLHQQLEHASNLPRSGRGWRDVRTRARQRYLEGAAELDKMLQEFSFIIPSRQLDKGRLPPHIAAARFDAACPP